MEEMQCKHIKYIDANSDIVEIEMLIKLIESEIRDLNTSLKWKQVLQKLQKLKNTFDSSMNSAARNEYNIIQKLYFEDKNSSPLWGKIKTGTIQKTEEEESKVQEEENIFDTEIDLEQLPENINENPDIENTDIIPADNAEIIEEIKTNDSAIQTVPVDANEDNHPSPIAPHPSFSDKNNVHKIEIKSNKQSLSQYLSKLIIEDHMLKPIPETLIVTENNTKEKVFKIRVQNIGTEWKSIQFKDVSDSTSFQYVKLCPMTLTKICPGLTVVFKLTIKFKENVENISSGLRFRVFIHASKRNCNALFVPLISDFIKKRSIMVTESVYIPSVHSWQFNYKRRFPSGVLNINIKGDFRCEVYIRKQNFNVIDVNILSDHYLEAKNIESQSKINDSSVLDEVANESVEDISFESSNVIAFILDTAITQALDVFIINKTHLRLSPNSQKDVKICFTKAHCPGYYQSLYNLDFYDSDTEELITRKYVKVYAFLMRHPIEIEPVILDMSGSEITAGYCKGKFILRNCHRFITFKVRIETTKKMKEIFKITPTETSVPAKSNVAFFISSCIEMDYTPVSHKESVIFTIKVNITSNDQTFKDIPAIFYEVIMSCAKEFKTVYNIIDSYDDSILGEEESSPKQELPQHSSLP